MGRVKIIFRGVFAVCIIAAYSGEALATSIVQADLRVGFDSAALNPKGFLTSLYAFSGQDSPVARGPNVATPVSLTSNGVVAPTPALPLPTLGTPRPGDSIVLKTKGGMKLEYKPVVVLRNQPKALITKVGDIESLVSSSGFYQGSAMQDQTNPLLGLPRIAAAAETGQGIPPGAGGSAAGEAVDPFTVPGGMSYAYGPTIDATLQLQDSATFGGVELYSVDSFVFTDDDVANFVADGSPFENTLWNLSLTANGPLTSTTSVDVAFQLNPAALTEILLPTPYLMSLPGFKPSMNAAAVAQLVDAAIAGAIGGQLQFKNGAVVLKDFPLFPAGTLFAPAGGDVVFADGAAAALTAVPEPGTLWLLSAGLFGLAVVSSERRKSATGLVGRLVRRSAHRQGEGLGVGLPVGG
jgi:hypothetical protein